MKVEVSKELMVVDVIVLDERVSLGPGGTVFVHAAIDACMHVWECEGMVLGRLSLACVCSIA